MSCDKSVVLGCLCGFVSLSLTFGLGSDVHVPPIKPFRDSNVPDSQRFVFGFSEFLLAAVSQYHALKHACYWDVHGTCT